MCAALGTKPCCWCALQFCVQAMFSCGETLERDRPAVTSAQEEGVSPSHALKIEGTLEQCPGFRMSPGQGAAQP